MSREVCVTIVAGLWSQMFMQLKVKAMMKTTVRQGFIIGVDLEKTTHNSLVNHLCSHKEDMMFDCKKRSMLKKQLKNEEEVSRGHQKGVAWTLGVNNTRTTSCECYACTLL